MWRKWSVKGVVTLAAFSVVLVAAPSGSGDASLACGDVITADVTLTADLTNCRGDGIVIGADDITLDLNGHVVSGTGGGSGVHSPGLYSGLTVINGTIRRFSTGIELWCYSGCPSFDSNVLQSLHVTDNGRGILATSFQGGPATFVTDSVIRNNTGDAIEYAYAVTGDITNNTVFSNGGVGIYRYFDSDGAISRNNIHDNGSGIELWYSPGHVVDNTVRDNNGIGIFTFDNVAAAFPYYYIASNTAAGNGGYGIAATGLAGDGDPSVEDGGGNAAKNNATTPQCLNIVCALHRGRARMYASSLQPPLHPTQ